MSRVRALMRGFRFPLGIGGGSGGGFGVEVRAGMGASARPDPGQGGGSRLGGVSAQNGQGAFEGFSGDLYPDPGQAF